MGSADLPLMQGSISHNIRYRKPGISKDDFEKIQESCGLNRMLTELPDGLQTRVLEGGRNLSMGQRQKIAMARAIIGNPLILLLDEIDANLDSEAGKALDRVLDQFKGTVIMVSHQPERISKADVVWEMENGRLVGVKPVQKG